MTAPLCLTYKLSTTDGAGLNSLRSLLFAPGNDERKLRGAAGSAADAVIADLEDSVPPAVKDEARALVLRVLPGAGSAARLVRVNGADTQELGDDLAMVAELRPDALVLPKATPDAVDAVAQVGLPVVAIAETALGIRLAYETASRPPVFALLIGAVDLAAELGLEPRADGMEIQYVRSKLVVDSAAAGVRPPFDIVHVGLGDYDALEAEALLARSLGLRGKACIHPSQVEVVNRVFTPAAATVGWAERVLEAAESAAHAGSGAVAVDGAMVDEAVVARARRILSESERSQTP